MPKSYASGDDMPPTALGARAVSYEFCSLFSYNICYLDRGLFFILGLKKAKWKVLGSVEENVELRQTPLCTCSFFKGRILREHLRVLN
jgi:hypothetical protein